MTSTEETRNVNESGACNDLKRPVKDEDKEESIAKKACGDITRSILLGEDQATQYYIKQDESKSSLPSEPPPEKNKKKFEDDISRDYYFKGYANINIHRDMIADNVRTMAYRKAILKNYNLFRGKVVADIGAGTGILSVFCVHAGAKKVYAIEACQIADQARLVAAENDMTDKITVIHGKVEDVVLPEKVDVIVSEWMPKSGYRSVRGDGGGRGCDLAVSTSTIPEHKTLKTAGTQRGYCLLYESMLACVLDARDRWLKPGGSMFPCSATLYLAPYSDLDQYHSDLTFWDSVNSTCKVKMTSLKPYALKCLTQCPHVQCVDVEGIMAGSEPVVRLDLHTMKEEDLKKVTGDFEFSCYGQSRLHGFVSWFAVTFPGEVELTTSPFDDPTHWAQSVFYVDEPEDAEQDSRITGSICIQPSQIHTRFLEVSLDYMVENSTSRRQHYIMDDMSS